MTSNERLLQLHPHVEGNELCCKGAETGGDSVVGFGVAREGVDGLAGLCDLIERRWIELDTGVVTRNVDEFFGGEWASANDDGHVHESSRWAVSVECSGR